MHLQEQDSRKKKSLKKFCEQEHEEFGLLTVCNIEKRANIYSQHILTVLQTLVYTGGSV